MLEEIVFNHSFTYWQSGTSPRLLIHSGTHGDEYEVIDIVSSYLKEFTPMLPSYIYVPKVSPSAVAKKTRYNNNNRDINRIFFSHTSDPEVQSNIDIIKSNTYDLVISFHEDPDSDQYYIYDYCKACRPNPVILSHNHFLHSQGISLFNGIDDPTDPHLGHKFIDGYRLFTANSKDTYHGMVQDWLFHQKITNHVLNPEIPGKISHSKKTYIVETFFTQVVLKWQWQNHERARFQSNNFPAN